MGTHGLMDRTLITHAQAYVYVRHVVVSGKKFRRPILHIKNRKIHQKLKNS